MKHKKTIASIIALVIILVASVTAAYAYSPERRMTIKDAIENNNYEAWKKLMEENIDEMQQMISGENFAKLHEMDALMKEGKFEEARKIREELGFPAFGLAMGGGFRGGHAFAMENREAVQNALENNDYDAWLKAVGEDSKIAEIINKDNFAKLVEAHNLMKEGKFEEARKIREELGFPMRCGGYTLGGRGFKKW